MDSWGHPCLGAAPPGSSLLASGAALVQDQHAGIDRVDLHRSSVAGSLPRRRDCQADYQETRRMRIVSAIPGIERVGSSQAGSKATGSYSLGLSDQL